MAFQSRGSRSTAVLQPTFSFANFKSKTRNPAEVKFGQKNRTEKLEHLQTGKVNRTEFSSFRKKSTLGETLPRDFQTSFILMKKFQRPSHYIFASVVADPLGRSAWNTEKCVWVCVLAWVLVCEEGVSDCGCGWEKFFSECVFACVSVSFLGGKECWWLC